jgi:hypothetical protein
MKKKTIITSILLSAVLISFLFHREDIGLNLVIFECLFIVWLLISKQAKITSRSFLLGTIATLSTLTATIAVHSTFSYIMHFIVLAVFVGLLIYPETKSLISSVGLSISSIFSSQSSFIKQISNSELKGIKISSYLWRSRIFLIPLAIITVFVIIYRYSNPVFDEMLTSASNYLCQKLNLLFVDFDFLIIFTFITALLFSNYLLIRKPNQSIIDYDSNSNSELKRSKRKYTRSFKLTALKNEYKSGVFLFTILNVILLSLCIIEIKYVWFNFEWEGQYLKEFVHHGTYLLILSIIISIGLVLFYFRGNINFYKQNSVLKYLSYFWLAQNAILVISVAIRNYWYIHYFSLAYKRIGVFIFLILTLYGLYSVYIKVKNRKSNFHLLRRNILSILIVLTISSFVNWDQLIAKYNFNNSNQSFIHLDFLSDLSDKALPYLDKDLEELEQLNYKQKEKFMFRVAYMTPYKYKGIIKDRKQDFIKEWEAKSLLSWNLAEYKSYQKLTKETLLDTNQE